MKSKPLSLFLIILLLGFPQISETIYTPSLPDIAHQLKTSDQLVEFTLSIYFIGFALGVFMWGVLSDWLGRRPSLLAGISLYSIGCLGCFMAHSIEALLVWRLIQALGASAGSVVTQTMIRDLYSGTERNQIFSIVGGAIAFSPAIGPILGGYVDQLVGWRGNFAVLIGMGLFLFLYSYWSLPETRLQHQPFFFKKVAKKFLTDQKVLVYALLIGGCNGIIFSYYAEAPFIFIDWLHYTPIQYGCIGLVLCAAGLLASLVSHRLNQYFETEKIILGGCLCIVLGASSLTLLSGFGLIQPEMGLARTFVLLADLGFIFLGIGILTPNCLSHALTAYQQLIGTAGALFGLLYYILIAAFTFFMGVLHNGTTTPMPLYFLTLSLVMSLTFYLMIYSSSLKSVIVKSK